MLIKELKQLGFDFNNIPSDINNGVELLRKQTNGTFETDNQKLGVLDNTLFDSIMSLHPENETVKLVSLKRATIEATIENDGFNTDLSKSDKFKEWFGESKIVDESGNPLLVYHGTTKNFTEFNLKHAGKNTTESGELGFFFTPDYSLSVDFTRHKWSKGEKSKLKKNSHVLSVYLSVKNPMIIGGRQFMLLNSISEYRAYLIEEGYDGLIIEKFDEGDRTSYIRLWGKDGIKEFESNQYVAFYPNQIKSATDNNGNFDESEFDITMNEGGEVNNHTDYSKAVSASSRFKPYETIVFDKPIVGVNGAELISYTWAYEWIEQFHKEEGLISKRISDWSQAEQNADTGRNIVHQFSVKFPDGRVSSVSSESVLVLLGYTDKQQLKTFPSLVNALKTLAKQRMQLSIFKAKQKEYEEVLESVKKMEMPPIVEKEYKPMGNGGVTVYSMGDAQIWQHDKISYDAGLGKSVHTKLGYIESERKESIIDSWISGKLKELGVAKQSGIYDLENRIKRQERKVEQLTGGDVQIKLRDGGDIKLSGNDSKFYDHSLQPFFKNKIDKTKNTNDLLFEESEKLDGGLDELMESLSEEIVLVDKIVPTQEGYSETRLNSLSGDAVGLPLLVKIGELYYVEDGHHRIIDNVKGGKVVIKAKVFHVNNVNINITSANYHENTIANFVMICDNKHDAEKELKEIIKNNGFKYFLSEGGSIYAIKDAVVYRFADHWGQLDSCKWNLIDRNSNEIKTDVFVLASCPLSEFKTYIKPTNTMAQGGEITSWKEDIKKLYNGELSVEAYKKAYTDLLANKDLIIVNLQSMKKDELLGMLGGTSAYRYKTEKKERVVIAVWDDMLMSFALGTVSYGMNDKMVDVIQKKVNAITEAELASFAEQVAKSREERKQRMLFLKKAITNPETLEEFKIFIVEYGKEKLTSEQLIAYDDLVSGKTKEQREADAVKKAQIQAVQLGEISMNLIETEHTRDKYPLFVVKLTGRVDSDVFKDLSNKAKRLSGWYSSFTKNGAIAGFQFKEKEQAEKFMGLQEGDVSNLDKVIERKEERKEGTAVKLRELGEKTIAKAEEELGRERLTNTNKRARQASSSDESSYKSKRIGETMINISDAIASGEAKHLEGIKSKSHIELLDSMVSRAKYREVQKKLTSQHDRDRMRGEPATIETVNHFEGGYYPNFYKGNLSTLLREVEGKDGFKLLANRWQKKIKGVKDDDYFYPKSDEEMEELERMVLSNANFNSSTIKGQLDDYKRLKSMGIANDSMLRSALREYITFRAGLGAIDKHKQLERAVVGKKVGFDFFPTPKTVCVDMVDMAEINDGMDVLEPSAGNGNIAEVIREQHPNINLDVIELSGELRSILEAKNFNVVANDFLGYDAKKYDRIIMNPPFSDSNDIIHIQYAYELLKSGGVIVAIMGAGAFQRSDKRATAFREWIDEIGADVEELPANTFMDKSLLSTTGANAKLVKIRKETTEFDKPEPKKDVMDSELKEESVKEKIDKKFNVSGKYKEQGIEFGKGLRLMITDGIYASKNIGKDVQKDAEKLYDSFMSGDLNKITEIRTKYFSEWNKSKSLAGTQRDRHIPINTAKLELYNKANAVLIYIDYLPNNNSIVEEKIEEPNNCGVGEIETSLSGEVDGKVVKSTDVIVKAFDSAFKTKEYINTIATSMKSMHTTRQVGSAHLDFGIPQWHYDTEGNKLYFEYKEGSDCPYAFVTIDQETIAVEEAGSVEILLGYDQHDKKMYGANIKYKDQKVFVPVGGFDTKEEMQEKADKVLSELKAGTYKDGMTFEEMAGRKNINAIEKMATGDVKDNENSSIFEKNDKNMEINLLIEKLKIYPDGFSDTDVKLANNFWKNVLPAHFENLQRQGFTIEQMRGIIYGINTIHKLKGDTEFEYNGIYQMVDDYANKILDGIERSAEINVYEAGLKYPKIEKWVLDKVFKAYGIPTTPVVIKSTRKSIAGKDKETIISIYSSKDWIIAHSGDIENLRGSNLLDGDYWAIISKNRDLLPQFLIELFDREESYVKDLDLYFNGMTSVDYDFLREKGILVYEDDKYHEFAIKGGESANKTELFDVYFKGWSFTLEEIKKRVEALGISYDTWNTLQTEGGDNKIHFEDVTSEQVEQLRKISDENESIFYVNPAGYHRETGMTKEKTMNTEKPKKHEVDSYVQIIDEPESYPREQIVVGHQNWNENYGWETTIKNSKTGETVTMFENLLEAYPETDFNDWTVEFAEEVSKLGALKAVAEKDRIQSVWKRQVGLILGEMMLLVDKQPDLYPAYATEVLALKPSLRSPLNPYDYDLWNSDTVQKWVEESGKNILDYLPVEEYSLPKYKPFETSHEDKVFMDIQSKFAGTDDLRPMMLGTHFSKEGIVSTNAHILLFTPYRGNEYKDEAIQTYCHTKKCLEKKDEVANGNYPKYMNVIPSTIESKHIFNAHAVYNYLKNINDLGLINATTQRFSFRYTEGGEHDLIGFNAVFMLIAIEGLIKLGHTELEIGFTSKSRPALIYPAKSASKSLNFKEDFVLIMPVLLDEWKSVVDYSNVANVRGTTAYDLETNCFVFIGSENKYCFDLHAIKEKKREEKTKKIEDELAETKNKLAKTESVLTEVLEADKAKLETEQQKIIDAERELDRNTEINRIKEELDAEKLIMEQEELLAKEIAEEQRLAKEAEEATQLVDSMTAQDYSDALEGARVSLEFMDDEAEKSEMSDYISGLEAMYEMKRDEEFETKFAQIILPSGTFYVNTIPVGTLPKLTLKLVPDEHAIQYSIFEGASKKAKSFISPADIKMNIANGMYEIISNPEPPKGGKKQKTIEETTNIIPEIVAETVAIEYVQFMHKAELDKWEKLTKVQKADLDKTVKLHTEKIEKYLVDRAETHYAHNEEFRKKVNGKGRAGLDFLIMFMKHWAGIKDGKITSIERSMERWYKEAGIKHGFEILVTPTGSGFEPHIWTEGGAFQTFESAELQAKSIRKMKDRYSKVEVVPSKMAHGEGKFVAVHESKDGYWTIASKPTSKENAEAMLGGTPKNETGKVVTLEEAKAHKKVLGDEYLYEDVFKEGGEVNMEVEVEKDMADFYIARIWINSSWKTFSRHRYKADADKIKQMLESGISESEISKEIEEQNKTSYSKIANTQGKFEDGGEITKETYRYHLDQYDLLGAHYEDTEDEIDEVVRESKRKDLKQQMDELESKIHRYERADEYKKGGELDIPNEAEIRNAVKEGYDQVRTGVIDTATNETGVMLVKGNEIFGTYPLKFKSEIYDIVQKQKEKLKYNLDTLKGRLIEVFLLGDETPSFETIHDIEITPSVYEHRVVTLLLESHGVNRIPLNKFPDFMKGEQIELKDSKGEPYAISLVEIKGGGGSKKSEIKSGRPSDKFELGTPAIYHSIINGEKREEAGEIVMNPEDYKADNGRLIYSPKTIKGLSLYPNKNYSGFSPVFVVPNDWRNVETFYEANKRHETGAEFIIIEKLKEGGEIESVGSGDIVKWENHDGDYSVVTLNDDNIYATVKKIGHLNDDYKGSSNAKIEDLAVIQKYAKGGEIETFIQEAYTLGREARKNDDPRAPAQNREIMALLSKLPSSKIEATTETFNQSSAVMESFEKGYYDENEVEMRKRFPEMYAGRKKDGGELNKEDELSEAVKYINYLKKKKKGVKSKIYKAEIQAKIDGLLKEYKEMQSGDKKMLGGVSLGAMLGVVGTYSYEEFKKEQKDIIPAVKKVSASGLPSKIAQWDDLKGWAKSGKRKRGDLMPAEFRHKYKFDDKLKKWVEVDSKEFESIFMSSEDYSSGANGKKHKEKGKDLIWKLQTN